MNCPYCDATEGNCVPDVVYINAESCGGGIRKFNCKKCGKVVRAAIAVRVFVLNEQKTDEPSDW